MKIRWLPRRFAVGMDMPMRASGSPSAHSSALADGPLSTMAEMPGTAKSVVEDAEWTRMGRRVRRGFMVGIEVLVKGVNGRSETGCQEDLASHC